jgi:hypothetical protein
MMRRTAVNRTRLSSLHPSDQSAGTVAFEGAGIRNWALAEWRPHMGAIARQTGPGLNQGAVLPRIDVL